MKSVVVATLFVLFAALACEASWSGTPSPQPPEAAMLGIASPLASPRPSATKTPAPTATTGYQATIEAQDAQLAAAQSTRDALSRLQSDVTLQAISITQQAGQWTAEAFVAGEHHIAETQAAATPAAIATETQQARDDEKTARLLAVSSGMLTGTSEAPARLAALQDLALQKQYGELDEQVGLAVKITFVLLGLLFGPSLAGWSYVLLVRYVRTPYRRKPVPDEVSTPAPRVIPQIARTDGLLVKAYNHDTAGYVAMTADEWPCTEEQFDELAVHVVENNGRLIVRRFDGKAAGSSWPRDRFTLWREWAQRHNPVYVIQGRDDLYYASQTLKGICHARVEGRLSPSTLAFMPDDGNLADGAAHTRGPRTAEHAGTRGGGDGWKPLAAGLKRLEEE